MFLIIVYGVAQVEFIVLDDFRPKGVLKKVEGEQVEDEGDQDDNHKAKKQLDKE
ncbi:hypothetical protein Back11_48310 [Paenibacillus baekrokdamisoli]|uniref:Uncharacterized protein n=1 Tax=Paenibacillus baekrokdamisoli TaxID=1712516 RepID=A0A3G9IY90_9BACL|nr:hypothetical protein [Paenibacillus baekrokdamisoli]MBB3068654.1 hypothetical protein [Paenibacillus baekrokdamisoli]BBH23486.1 hypothetical protein Back11_48310 [Paenibacillus baekrokdamisoli]